MKSFIPFAALVAAALAAPANVPPVDNTKPPATKGKDGSSKTGGDTTGAISFVGLAVATTGELPVKKPYIIANGGSFWIGKPTTSVDPGTGGGSGNGGGQGGGQGGGEGGGSGGGSGSGSGSGNKKPDEKTKKPDDKNKPPTGNTPSKRTDESKPPTTKDKTPTTKDPKDPKTPTDKTPKHKHHKDKKGSKKQQTIFTYTNGALTLATGEKVSVDQTAGLLSYSAALTTRATGTDDNTGGTDNTDNTDAASAGFAIVSNTQLQFEGKDWLACPPADSTSQSTTKRAAPVKDNSPTAPGTPPANGPSGPGSKDDGKSGKKGDAKAAYQVFAASRVKKADPACVPFTFTIKTKKAPKESTA